MTSTARATATTSAAADLVGRWSTQNVCQDEVRALEDAGLPEFVREWVAGAEYPGASATEVAPSEDPCQGATPMVHSHTFGTDGSFASYNQDGQQVDDGEYTAVDDQTFTLADPPVLVRYEIDGDNATFTVLPSPDCTSMQCRASTAYVISAFFPVSYQRVG